VGSNNDADERVEGNCDEPISLLSLLILTFWRPQEAPYKVYPPKFLIFALKGAKISG
jgi:hypothetical protein